MMMVGKKALIFDAKIVRNIIIFSIFCYYVIVTLDFGYFPIIKYI